VTAGDFGSSLQARLELVGLSLEPRYVAPAERYYQLLRRWNAATNLTSLPLDDFPARTLDRLFVEALQAAELIDPSLPPSPLYCVDVGSGGGSPAIPLNIARPALRLTMVESVAKKAAFLREAAREVGLEHADVLTERIEHVAPGRIDNADIVLLRGVRIDRSLTEVLIRLLKPNGRILRFGPKAESVPEGFSAAERRPLATGGELVVLEAESRRL